MFQANLIEYINSSDSRSQRRLPVLLQAQSEFAKNNTIAQQRRSLPVYSVREELLQVTYMRHITLQMIACPLHVDGPFLHIWLLT